MRSDRRKVNCHDAKAYLPAGELELVAVLAHVHMRARARVCVCVCVACPRGTECRVHAKPGRQGLAPEVFTCC